MLALIYKYKYFDLGNVFQLLSHFEVMAEVCYHLCFILRNLLPAVYTSYCWSLRAPVKFPKPLLMVTQECSRLRAITFACSGVIILLSVALHFSLPVAYIL